MNETSFLRDAIGEGMVQVGDREKKAVAVSANVMASSRAAAFMKKYPDRAFNVGISEQTMVSFAAGMAREGFISYTFTMAPFMSLRACEQIRTDVAYDSLNVRFIATYAGVSGGISGATHWGLEDFAVVKGMPGMTVLEPCDATQAKKMMLASIDFKGPLYFRIGIEPVPQIYPENYDYQIGRADFLRRGSDGTFICAGITVKYALEAAQLIYRDLGKQVTVIDMHTIKPIDRTAVYEAIKTKNIVVAQDHTIIGGLGDSIAAVIVDSGQAVNYKVLGLPDKFFALAHAPYLYHQFGYDTDGLYKAMRELLEKSD